ncbi:MAG: phosphoribosylformylglycinamidine cyclo-ligase [Acidimicrobiales bacterium]
MSEPAPATYAGVGVDIVAGEAAVDRIRPLVASTLRPEVLGSLGDFAGLFAIDTGKYRQPVLVAATDGVGTKASVAHASGRYDTIGIDLVAMCVDDLVCQGAEPLFFLDYISTGAVDPGQMEELVAGVAAGCRRVGAALLGGEMAEHAGAMKPGEFDLVGFAVGVVEREEALGSSRVRPGDILVGLPSPGLRSNGYTLARHVLLERAGLTLGAPAWGGAATSVADELLLPSVLYTPAILAAIAAAGDGIHAIAHITGGGIPGNLLRALPIGLRAVVERGRWEVPRIFAEIRRLGNVEDEEMSRVFNLGLGMVVIASSDGADAALEALRAAGHDAMVAGRVEPGPRGVELVGTHRWGASDTGAPDGRADG